MGFLSRAAKNIRGSFAPRGAESRFDNWSLGDYAGMPIVRNAPAMGIVGAGTGAIAGGNNESMANGAMIGAGIGVGIPYSVAAKRIVMAVAKAMKKAAPQQPDEVILQQAQRVAEQARAKPDARKQIEDIIGKIDWDN